jgi:hypothetical protein
MTIAANMWEIKCSLALAHYARVFDRETSPDRRQWLLTKQNQLTAELAAIRNAVSEQTGKPFYPSCPSMPRELRRNRWRWDMRPRNAWFATDGR